MNSYQGRGSSAARATFDKHTTAQARARSASLISVSRTSAGEGGAGAAGGGGVVRLALFISLTIMKMQNARIRKLITIVMKSPYARTGPSLRASTSAGACP